MCSAINGPLGFHHSEAIFLNLSTSSDEKVPLFCGGLLEVEASSVSLLAIVPAVVREGLGSLGVECNLATGENNTFLWCQIYMSG